MSISGDKNMHMPSDEEIAVNVHQNGFNDESTPRLIYYLQETKNRFIPNTGGFNYFVAEYIIPKPSKANEKNYPPHANEMLESERKIRIKTLGNFLLLVKPRYTNDKDREEDEQSKMAKALKKASNEVFSNKRNVLKSYISNVICSNWFNSQNSWGESDIQKRNREFASGVITRVWAI